MTPADLAQRRHELGLTQAQLARCLGVHRQTVAGWEQGRDPVPPYVPLALAGLAAAACPTVTTGRRIEPQ